MNVLPQSILPYSLEMRIIWQDLTFSKRCPLDSLTQITFQLQEDYVYQELSNMNSGPASENSPASNVLSIAAALVIVVAGLHAARAIVVPLLLAIFIAVIISSLLSWLRKYDIHTGTAVILLLVSLGVFGTTMVSIVGASANQLMNKLPEINKAAKKTEGDIRLWLEKHGISSERPEQEKKPAPQSLEISVPGYVPVPGEKGAAPDSAEIGKETNDQKEKLKKSDKTETSKLPDSSGKNNNDSTESSSEKTEKNSTGSIKTSEEEIVNPDSSVKTQVKENEETEEPTETNQEKPTSTQTVESPSPTGRLVPEESTLPSYIYRPQRHVIELLPSTPVSSPRMNSGDYLGGFSPAVIFRSFLDSVVGMFNYALIVFLMLVFLLLEWSKFGQRFEALPGNTQASIERVAEILASIRRYMFIKTLVSLLTGILISLWLMFLGVEYAVLWGTVAFLFNYIPTIGSLIAGIVPTLFVLVDQSPLMAVHVGIAFLVVNFLIGNLLEPRIMGEGLGISTFVVFLSLVFWGWVLGPAGMLLAVPITMALKIAIASDERTAWIATLIGARTSPAPSLPQENQSS